MTEKTTDTQRLDFLELTSADLELIPGGWEVALADFSVFRGQTPRDAIDAAMKGAWE